MILRFWGRSSTAMLAESSEYFDGNISLISFVVIIPQQKFVYQTEPNLLTPKSVLVRWALQRKNWFESQFAKQDKNSWSHKLAKILWCYSQLQLAASFLRFSIGKSNLIATVSSLSLLRWCSDRNSCIFDL